jgi:hypothetical protein
LIHRLSMLSQSLRKCQLSYYDPKSDRQHVPVECAKKKDLSLYRLFAYIIKHGQKNKRFSGNEI